MIFFQIDNIYFDYLFTQNIVLAMHFIVSCNPFLYTSGLETFQLDTFVNSSKIYLGFHAI